LRFVSQFSHIKVMTMMMVLEHGWYRLITKSAKYAEQLVDLGIAGKQSFASHLNISVTVVTQAAASKKAYNELWGRGGNHQANSFHSLTRQYTHTPV